MKTAEQAIQEIKAEKTTFIGQIVRKHGPLGLRSELRKMAAGNKISPAEYLKALRITFKDLSPAEKQAEYDEITGITAQFLKNHLNKSLGIAGIVCYQAQN